MTYVATAKGSTTALSRGMETTYMTNGFLRTAIAAAILWPTAASVTAADLKPEALQQWDEYVKTVDARNQEHLAPSTSFLSSEEIPAQTARLRAGEVVVSPVGEQVPMKIRCGLIHDWIGAAFIPNTTLSDVLALVRDYDHYKDYYQPNVIESKWIATSDSSDQFSMVIINKSAVAKTAIDSDYRSRYTRVDEHRWYSISDATRIQEIADYDTPNPHELPENHGTGLIWRLHSITRFEEQDGGVYIELEAVALSRDIPAALRWFIDPIVRRVSRSSLATSLHQTENAARLHSASISASNNGSVTIRSLR